MRLATAPFHAAEVPDTEEAIEEFIAAACETEDPAFMARPAAEQSSPELRTMRLAAARSAGSCLSPSR
jgi:DNA-binding phage protein